MVLKDPNHKGRTREEMGLRPFTEVEIRSNILEMDVCITQSHIARLLKGVNKRNILSNFRANPQFQEKIKAEIFEKRKNAGLNLVSSLKDEFKVLFKILTLSVFPRDNLPKHLTYEDKYCLYFLSKGIKINLSASIFEHLCDCIKESHDKSLARVAHPRLLSELFYQTKLIERLKENFEAYVEEVRGCILDAEVLIELDLKWKDDIRTSLESLVLRS
ncbi:hypothetical protein A2U01_0027016, partial [Trifolium medium]|nr:hypothetical protein [Trifolium medium]